ncbi:hypothetical protein D3C84_1128510 [compost metagenome]
MAVSTITLGASAVEGQRPGDLDRGAMTQENLFEQLNERIEIERLGVRTDGHFGRYGHLKLQFYY